MSPANGVLSVVPNESILGQISMTWANAMEDKDDKMSTTELDTHVNMVVIGGQAKVIHQ